MMDYMEGGPVPLGKVEKQNLANGLNAVDTMNTTAAGETLDELETNFYWLERVSQKFLDQINDHLNAVLKDSGQVIIIDKNDIDKKDTYEVWILKKNQVFGGTKKAADAANMDLDSIKLYQGPTRLSVKTAPQSANLKESRLMVAVSCGNDKFLLRSDSATQHSVFEILKSPRGDNQVRVLTYRTTKDSPFQWGLPKDLINQAVQTAINQN